MRWMAFCLVGPRLVRPGVNMAPVVQAERDVAVLLNLKHYDAASQGVDGSSRQENAVTSLRSEVREVIGYGPVADRLAQILRRGAWLQAVIDTALRPRLQNHPCLRLSAFAWRQQVSVHVRGMHLDGEHFACVQELQQQGKPTEPLSQFTQHLHWKLVQQLSDGSPLERPIGSAAGMVLAIAQYPRFPNWADAWQRCCEQVRQTPAAPEAVLIDRLEAQGIERGWTHGLDYSPVAWDCGCART